MKIMDDVVFSKFTSRLKNITFTQEQRESLLDILLVTTKDYEKYLEYESAQNKFESKSYDTTYREWGAKYSVFDGFLDEEVRVAYFVYKYGGFKPEYYNKKAWKKFLYLLLKAGDNNMDIIEEGIKAGKKAREKGALTFKNPLAFRAFIVDLATKGVMKNFNFEEDRENKEIWA